MKLALVQMDYDDSDVSIIAIEIADGEDEIEIAASNDPIKPLPNYLELEVKALIQKLKAFMRE
jgi:hypothetical protein